jgi:hypothetical protein
MPMGLIAIIRHAEFWQAVHLRASSNQGRGTTGNQENEAPSVLDP